MADTDSADRHCENHHQCEGDPHFHLCLAANRVMLETEHLVEAAVDTLHRSTSVVCLLPFVGVAGNRSEDAAVQLEWHTHHTTEFAHPDGRKLLTFGSPGAFKSKGCGGAPVFKRHPILLEAKKGELAQLVKHLDDETPVLDEQLEEAAEGVLGGNGLFTEKRVETAKLPQLAWCQEFSTRDEAREAEHQIKRWSRAKKKALIAGDFDLLRSLAGRSKLSRALRDASK